MLGDLQPCVTYLLLLTEGYRAKEARGTLP